MYNHQEVFAIMQTCKNTNEVIDLCKRVRELISQGIDLPRRVFHIEALSRINEFPWKRKLPSAPHVWKISRTAERS